MKRVLYHRILLLSSQTADHSKVTATGYQTLFEVLASEDFCNDLPDIVKKVKLNLFFYWYVFIDIWHYYRLVYL